MTTLETIIGILFLFAAGVYVGWVLREWVAIKILERFMSQSVPDAPESEPEIVSCTLEKHGDVFYVFSKEENQFLGQGKDEAELTVVLKERFPGKQFSLDGVELNKLRGVNDAKSV